MLPAAHLAAQPARRRGRTHPGRDDHDQGSDGRPWTNEQLPFPDGSPGCSWRPRARPSSGNCRHCSNESAGPSSAPLAPHRPAPVGGPRDARQGAAAVGRRDAAIEGALRSAARELVQAGLFDRLALRRGTRRPAGPVLCGNIGESGADDPAGAGAVARRAVREARVIAGMSGSLLSHDAVERLIATGEEPELSPERWTAPPATAASLACGSSEPARSVRRPAHRLRSRRRSPLASELGFSPCPCVPRRRAARGRNASMRS